MTFSSLVLFIASLKCNGNCLVIESGCFLAKSFHMKVYVFSKRKYVKMFIEWFYIVKSILK